MKTMILLGKLDGLSMEWIIYYEYFYRGVTFPIRQDFILAHELQLELLKISESVNIMPKVSFRSWRTSCVEP